MGKARLSYILAGLVAAVVIVAGGTTAAHADQLVVDGIAPLDPAGQNASVTMCLGQSAQVPILIAARRNGGDTNNVFKDGGTVTVSLKSASAGLSVSLSGTTIPIPRGWQTAKNNTLTDDTITATVTVAARQAIGTVNGTLTFSYSGAQVGGGLVTGDASISLSSTVQNCDTTPPTLNLPSSIIAEATSASGATVTYTASATDDVNPASPAVTCSPVSGSTFVLGATTVNCTAKDAANNVANGSFVVTVRDTTAPAVGQPSDVRTEATGSTTTVTWTVPTAHDLVDGDLATTCVPASGTGFSVGSTLVTCSVTDAHGNKGSAGFHVIVSDTSAPTLTLPSNLVAEATGPSGAQVGFTASASDVVDGAVTVNCVPVSGSTFALATTTVNCGATDAAGNTASGSFTVTVKDTTAPVVTVPADKVLEATGATGATATFVATASDAVSGTSTPSCSPASGAAFPLGSTTVTCSATDSAGNTGSATFTVSVLDRTPPTITVPTETVVLEATGPGGVVLAHYDASATDLVDGAVPVTCDPVEGSLLAIGNPTQVDCHAQDEAGNKARAAFAVKVQDTTGPKVTVPADVVAEATGAMGATVTFAASAVDLVDGSVPVNCSSSSGTTFALGETVVTCSAVDTRDNSGSATFSVTVRDTTAPQITVPSDLVREATGPHGAAVTYSASADDAFDGAVVPTCSPASGATFPVGETTVTCSAADAHGNNGSETFSVTVRDTTAPVVTVPDDITREATGRAGAVVTFSASAVDIVDGSVATSCSPASGSTFTLSDTIVTCSATDLHGNLGTNTFRVHVGDTTAPDVTVPDDITREATGPSGAVVTFTSSADDIVDGALATVCLPASGSTFAVTTATVTCAATDAHHNTGSNSFHVTITDTTAPDVTVPADITREATSSAGAVVTFTTSALDIVDGSVVTTCSPASGATFALGSTTVTCSATDAHGNTGSSTFSVTVEDTTAPDVTVPAHIAKEATGAAGAAVTFSVSALDTVDGAIGANCSPASGATFALGDTTVTCSATDTHHNTGSGNFLVTVQDTTAPALSVPDTIVQEATGTSGAVVTYVASALDVVDGGVTTTCSPASGATFALGSNTVMCSATDAHHNTGWKSFQVTVQDTTPPTITWVGGPTSGATYIFGSVPAAPTCTATDLVDASPTCTVTGYGNGTGSHTMTAVATDHSGVGNSSTSTRVFNVSGWTLGGFYQPVDMGSIWNTVKGGSTVPLKFEVFAGSTELTSTSVVSSFTAGVVPCGTLAEPTAEIELTSTGGTSLRYDTTGGQFIQNWQTPKTPGMCYKVTMKTQDGSSISALFKLK